jgi:hypothetical protein
MNNDNNNNQVTNNTAMDANDEKAPVPLVSREEYQKTLGRMSHEDIVTQLMSNGSSQVEAEELASEFDEDR